MQSVIVAIALLLGSATLSGASDFYGGLLLAQADRVCGVLGLQPLRTVTLPEGDVEVRIWTDHGIVYPHHLVRLFSSNSHNKGEIFDLWPGKLNPPAPCISLGESESVKVCQQKDSLKTEWKAVFEDLKSLSILSLPTQSKAPNVRDGSGFLIEVRQGTSYRNYAYIAPGLNPSHEEQIAKQIWTTVMHLVRRPGT